MSLSAHAAPLLVVAPLVGAVVAALAPGRAGFPAGVATTAAVSWALAALTRELLAGGPVRYALGGWGGPLGIDLVVDGMSLLMVWLTAVVGACTTLYARGYFAASGRSAAGFWPLWLALWAALHALFLTGDVFNLYVTLELSGLAAVALVGLGTGPRAVAASLRYLLVSMVGSMLFLTGVVVVYAHHGVLDLELLGRSLGEASDGLPARVCMASMLSGLFLKAALFPLHAWLPPAHAEAPGPVSAVLSALVVKAAFYAVWRLWTGPFAELSPPDAGALVGALGAGAVLWGGVQALRARRLKTLVAYSTVAQLGYLFLTLPLMRGGDDAGAAAQAAALLALSHGVAKAAMFLAASAVLHLAGNDRIDGLGGLGSRAPLTAVSLGLAGLSLTGLPPSGGFPAKWLLLSAAVDAGAWGTVAVVLVGGLLTAGYVLRVVAPCFSPEGEERPPLEVPPSMQAGALLLALSSLALGLLPALPLLVLARGAT